MKKSYNFWLQAWYGKSLWIYLLVPLSCLFGLVSALRKFVLINFLQKKIAVPVIVVGNISVGGTGKTPLIIELVKYLQQQGHDPGVVSRGYGGRAAKYPYLLTENSLASEAGDEPLLIYRATGCCVCVAPDRVVAANKLVEVGCSVILSDDGMQHYALGRNLEIAVIDGQRLFGNQKLLPVGPLREPLSRLKSVDLIVINNPEGNAALSGHQHSYAMKVQPYAWRKIESWTEYPLNGIPLTLPIHAVAGIGNPQRFFNSLDELSLNYYAHAFPDHHKFVENDFVNYGSETLVMTEKDAVKCQSFAKPEWYSLIVHAHLSEDFWQAFQRKLSSL